MVERVVRGDGDDEEEISWNLSTDVRYSNNKATGAIFIKKLAAIETDKPLPSQMRIITLSEVGFTFSGMVNNRPCIVLGDPVRLPTPCVYKPEFSI